MLLGADIPENKMKAMTVFAECIGYLKNHLLQSLKDQGTSTENQDIHWILTVPAIWSDPAKQFMRESAQKVISVSWVYKIRTRFSFLDAVIKLNDSNQ